jgi:hypothetical protein
LFGLKQKRKDNMILTVIFRDDAPMIHCGDSPSYRSVQIELTPEQRKQLEPRFSYATGLGEQEKRYYESISKCFIEPNASLTLAGKEG